MGLFQLCNMHSLKAIAAGKTPNRLSFGKRKAMDSKKCQDAVLKKLKNRRSLNSTFIRLRNGKERDAALEPELTALLSSIGDYTRKAEAELANFRNFTKEARQVIATIHTDRIAREMVATTLRNNAAAFDSRIDTPHIMQHIMEILPGENRAQFALSHRSAAAALSENVKRIQYPESPYDGLEAFMSIYANHRSPEARNKISNAYVSNHPSLRKVLTEEHRNRLVAFEKSNIRYRYRTGSVLLHQEYRHFRNYLLYNELERYYFHLLRSG